MKRLIHILMLPAIAILPAEEISWKAAGTVSSVTGSGLAASIGDPVSVKFSYDSGASPQGISELFGFYAEYGFHGSIGLTMEITIGASSWKGIVATVPGPPRASYPLNCKAYSTAFAPDDFTVTATSADNGVFDPFPYTGVETGRTIQVFLRDGVAPSNFLLPTVLPGVTTAVSEITAGSGFVSAGSDSIQFTIDPASVTVTSDEPRFPLFITRTLSGIELRWPTEDGVSYRLEESDALSGWQPYGSYFGTGADIVISLNPFDDHPERRFYRVVTE